MRRKWTKEKCEEIAKKYNNRNDYKIANESSYKAALKNKWLDEICSHMIYKRRPNNYWTKEKCKKVAKKYNKKIDFYNNDYTVYSVCIKNNWLDNFCINMEKHGDRYNRCVYVFEFENNVCYIGMTYNIIIREYQHNKKGPVFKYIKSNNINYKLLQISDYIKIEEAQKLEEETIQKYVENGWLLLNTNKKSTKGGSEIYWVYDKCKEESLKYDKKSDFQKFSRGAYGSSVKNGWYYEITKHMKTPKQWSVEDLDFLFENYYSKGVEYCMDKLNRTKKSIQWQIYVKKKLKIKKVG